MRSVVISLLAAALLTSSVCGYPSKEFKREQPEDHEQTSDTKEAYNNDDDDSDMYMEAMDQEEVQQNPANPVVNVNEGQAQTFYPSFSPFQNHPSGHSRPVYYQQETAYSHRPTGYQGQQFSYDSAPRFSGYKEINRERNTDNTDILGSGNFGVIRGGTFYDEEDRDHLGYEDRFNPYYYNGHGRPAIFRGNPRPTQHEQFANFRDFADINTPSSPAYSHYVVVYANSNGTQPEIIKAEGHKPRNIIEQLAMLDDEDTPQSSYSPSLYKENDIIEPKKISKSKRKLALLKPEKKPYIVKTAATHKELYEPLLALS